MFLLRLLLLCFLCFPALMPASAVIRRSYPEALQHAGHKPVVLFCYGANYDEVAVEFHDAFMNTKHIRDLLRRCMFVEVPLYQLPTEKQKQEMQEIIGPRGLPGGIRCYPCLVITDSRGYTRSVIQGPEEMKDVDTALKNLKERLENFDKQEKLLSKVETAGGPRRYRLLTEAVDIDKMNLPGNAADLGKRRRKRDKEGFEERIAFDPINFMRHISIFSPQKAEAYTREMMKNPGYSKTQRQEMLAALAGSFRRSRNKKDDEVEEGYKRLTDEEIIAKMRALYTEMYELAPDSLYGAYAESAIELWVKPLEDASDTAHGISEDSAKE